ncbi:unnamed protein product [Dimorphilus gyrociliatus]|uniref:Uncharacterized protein n=1 Tax=Dimorphilus gyrociliatus TaxID=2664684 RepID=A0A7I8WE97_9ANNE|nr:unnamed protein product [Dimorphilus gyrociliatus]
MATAISNKEYLKYDVEHCKSSVTILIYHVEGRCAGYAIFIDEQWKYTVNYRPTKYEKAVVSLNFVSNTGNMTTKEIQWKFTSNEKTWRKKAWKVVKQLLKPTPKAYDILSLNGAFNIENGRNIQESGGHTTEDRETKNGRQRSKSFCNRFVSILTSICRCSCTFRLIQCCRRRLDQKRLVEEYRMH